MQSKYMASKEKMLLKVFHQVHTFPLYQIIEMKLKTICLHFLNNKSYDIIYGWSVFFSVHSLIEQHYLYHSTHVAGGTVFKIQMVPMKLIPYI